MLIQFSVANFKSFKDRCVLSLVASRDDALPGNTFVPAQLHGMRLLRSAAIYGANASGKSNLLKALETMAELVRHSATRHKPEQGIPGMRPFRLDARTREAPTEFEVVFVNNGERYVYGFQADEKVVRSEWLTAAKSTKPRKLFERSAGSNGSPVISFGSSWQGPRDQLTRLTRHNTLFLSVAAQFESPAAKGAADWFDKCLRSVSDEPEYTGEMAFTTGLVEGDSPDREQIIRWIKHADFGIADVKVRRRAWSEIVFPSDLLQEERRKLESAYPDGVPFVQAGHKHGDRPDEHDLEWFSMDADESGGTRRFFSLLGPWLYALAHGCVLVVDELDTKLHPLLVRSLVEAFHSQEVNQRNAQLVFSTHDVSALRPDLLRRDQIWLTEKSPSQATDLYSLWDIRIRKDENFETGYLRGRYGAIPITGELWADEKG